VEKSIRGIDDEPGGRPRDSLPHAQPPKLSSRPRQQLGHSVATVLSYVFPNETDSAWAKANDNAWSGLWAGIHYRSDVDAGHALGHSR
jgi:hypothetical protein